ncbi:chemotaxis protein [Agrobacterium rubi]|uniref:chemotaxis protein n=1 Tax=Agrobacterium rubi TaxID=28099 RepID=UPI001571670A|nr:chemotaxis protein [Agrobacterium rubi]NTF06450.1 chemotaxis protein [Agrobacterium rubi]NTF18692.1 chemotaxis protein [Agrobacterium rubi]NTF25655.1 chemotaxis protein [Agrobacterium rubi]
MMKATRIAVLSVCIPWLASAGYAYAQSDLPPSKILRSLQFVQDSVVMGDHSAREMQKYLLETIDAALRTADPAIFEDSDNADAALAYIMSGGNPQTLDYLVARDVQGHFDTRVINVLQKYFSGRGIQAEKVISDLLPEYRKGVLGPYLMLIAGNITVTRDPVASLVYFDDARLTAPGTIIEEAALRRSIIAMIQAKQPDKTFSYVRKYAVRFLHSPYASQFADLFVSFVVDGYGAVTKENIEEIAQLMDDDRAEEIYLRIARQASLRGQVELARFATEQANALLPETGDSARAPLSKLYSGLASVSSDAVHSASASLSSIPSDELSPRDLALRDAAQAVAEQIVRTPTASPSPQAGGEDPVAESGAAPQASDTAMKPQEQTEQAAAGAPLKEFFDKSRARLSEIDSLLKQEER